MATKSVTEIPRRPLGRTGVEVSCLALGGYHLGLAKTEREAIRIKLEGKVRFVGFTGHKDPSIYLKMLSYDYPFDTCQLPLNVLDGTFRSFEQQVLPELNRRGIAALGMESTEEALAA